MKTIKDFSELKYGAVYRYNAESCSILILDNILVYIDGIHGITENSPKIYFWKYHVYQWIDEEITQELIENFKYLELLQLVLNSLENNEGIKPYRIDDLVESEITTLKQFIQDLKES